MLVDLVPRGVHRRDRGVGGRLLAIAVADFFEQMKGIGDETLGVVERDVAVVERLFVHALFEEGGGDADDHRVGLFERRAKADVTDRFDPLEREIAEQSGDGLGCVRGHAHIIDGG